ncbi:MAG: Na/Pi cotransporter family protein [Acutalibacteraceae bacterium]
MDIFDVLTFVGGISLFLFGMNYMGTALEKKAGGQMSALLERFTSNKLTAFLLGIVVTAVIQSSSATTVMVVGFVNSGILTLSQSVGVIIGANVGTTLTAWILSLTGIEGGSILLNLLKPSSFTPVIALIGVILYVFMKNSKKRDTGMILVGFAVLMFGMETASNAVSGLSEVPAFTKLFVLFENPVLGLLAGALLTAILQSSSASVGVLQALCRTGQITVGAALPIILGQNIGTCITAMISSVGASKNAKRAATIHLNFNLLGAVIIMILFYGSNAFLHYRIVSESANTVSIAVIHTLCNAVATAVFLPGSKLLEKISCAMVRDKKEEPTQEIILDERFFVNPALAVSQCRDKVCDMAQTASDVLKKATAMLLSYNEPDAENIIETEKKLDKYEDVISSYLVRLNTKEMSSANSKEVSKLLVVTGGFERLSDHAVHLEIYSKQIAEEKIEFTDEAKKELDVIMRAVNDIIAMTKRAFCENNIALAQSVEPLEQVVDRLTAKAKEKHIDRTLAGKCGFESGLVFSDVLSVLERVSDHCSEIAASIIEIPQGNLDVHAYLNEYKKRSNEEFIKKYYEYKEKYSLD